uniref:TRAP transporter large permease protein n=1 Tax=Chelativorans sp. (strain BNC1) TaxID=266779 RepID=Q11BZ4_CHESB
MEPEFARGLIIVAVLLVLLGSGIWIFGAIFLISLGGLFFLQDFSFVRIGTLMKTVSWRALTSYELASLPLFVWMAEILFRTRLSEQIFRGVSPWVDWVPGRLLHVVIVACGLFGAVSGSSTATCATGSKIALPELRKRGYDDGVIIGALSAGGTLGIMIPPSIAMVIYAVVAEVSLVKLMLAGFLPGLLMMGLFSGYICGWSVLNPHRTPDDPEPMRLIERFARLFELAPVAVLFIFIFGALFAGYITATECAAWGVAGALLIAAQQRLLTWETFKLSIRGTVRTTSMLVMLIGMAAIMSSFVALAGIPNAMSRAVDSLGVGPFGLVAILMLVFIVLGMFLDGMSMILLTLPVTLPMVVAAGFDPIWYGIFLILMIEIGELTPPVGFNLFVLQNITGKNIFSIGRMSFPFFLMMVICIFVLVASPQIVMVLPNLYH